MERRGNKREPGGEDVAGNDRTDREQKGVTRDENEATAENLGRQLKKIVAGEMRRQAPEFEEFILRAVVMEKKQVRPLTPSETAAYLKEEEGAASGKEWNLFWTVYGRGNGGTEEALIDRTTGKGAIAAYAAMTGDREGDSLRIANPNLLESEIKEVPSEADTFGGRHLQRALTEKV